MSECLRQKNVIVTFASLSARLFVHLSELCAVQSLTLISQSVRKLRHTELRCCTTQVLLHDYDDNFPAFCVIIGGLQLCGGELTTLSPLLPALVQKACTKDEIILVKRWE